MLPPDGPQLGVPTPKTDHVKARFVERRVAYPRPQSRCHFHGTGEAWPVPTQICPGTLPLGPSKRPLSPGTWAPFTLDLQP